MNKEHTIKTYRELSKIPYGHADKSITPGCIVVEGGAFRGLYNQGVLDALMENNLNFACTIGTSAGALAGFNYEAGQIGRSARANLTYRHYTDYVGRGALAHAHSPIRMDFLFNDYNAIEPFDEKTFFSPQRRFVAVATDCTTGKTAYFEKGKCRDIFSAIKASASMPYISPMVDVEGRPCLDGGCSCKIPYRWALHEGYEKIVVVRTREQKKKKKVSKRRHRFQVYHRYPEFAHRLANSSRAYNHQCEEILKLEEQGRIFVIAPSQKVTVGRLERDMNKLGDLYWCGYNDTLNRLDSLRSYLGGSSSLEEHETGM